jgi:hypothetical protein
MRPLPAIAVLLALALLVAPMPARAQRAVSLRDAVEQIERKTGGKILAANRVRVGQSKMFRIKVLTADGRVRVFQVPAAGN